MGFLGGLVLKNLAANARDTRDKGLIPGWERSPGGGNGNPRQYSYLGNFMDRRAWQAFMGQQKSQMLLSSQSKYKTDSLCLQQNLTQYCESALIKLKNVRPETRKRLEENKQNTL